MTSPTQLPQPIEWTPDPDHILAAIEWASRKLNYSIDRPNMNRRPLPESLDDKIMGDIATVAVVEYLRHHHVQAVAYDQIRTDNFQSPDPGWDVAFGPGTNAWAANPADPAAPEGVHTASVRSSRLPRRDTLDYAVQNRDFKIFAPARATIDQCITADIEMQVYYPYERTQLRNRTTTEDAVRRCASERDNCRQIATDLDIHTRYGSCFLTAWCTREPLIAHSATCDPPTWKSFQKRMWHAPLRLGRSFDELPSFASSAADTIG